MLYIINIMEYYSDRKRKEILIAAATWVTLKGTMLSKEAR